MSGRRRWMAKGAGFLVFGLALAAFLSFLVMLLWNQLIPVLFGGPKVHFWQAAGLLVLTRILVGGVRGRGGPWGHRASWRHGHWAMGRERWESMTAQERAQMRERFRGRCGWGADADSPQQPKV